MAAAPRPRLVTVALAALSAAAGAVHASLVAEHAAVAWWYGAGFAAVALLQLSWAALLLWRPPGRGVLAAGAIGHAVVLGVWLLARTAGLPFVPTEASTAIGVLDGVTAMFQAMIVVGVLAIIQGTARLRPPLQRAVGMAAVVVVLLTAPVTVAALAAGTGHEHDERREHDAGHETAPEHNTDHRREAAHRH